MELSIEKVSTWVKRRLAYEASRHPGEGLVGRSWAGWLLGLVPLGYPGGRSTGRYWAVGLLGLVPLGLLDWVCWLGEPSLGSWYPQCPPFPAGEEDHPRSEKKRNKLDSHIIGNSRPSMLHNFQCKFCNFYETVLDVIGSF